MFNFFYNALNFLIKWSKGAIFKLYIGFLIPFTRTRLNFFTNLFIGPHARFTLERGVRIAGMGYIDLRKRAKFYIGKRSLIGRGSEIIIDDNAICIIEDSVTIGSFSNIRCNRRIKIGSGTHLAQFVSIIGGQYKFKKRNISIFQQGFEVGDVVIGKDVWIGVGVIILPGIIIGDGAVIGAGSVVTRDIPDYSIAVGNPAKVISLRK